VKKRRVIVDPDAKEDLRALHGWIVLQGSPKSATAYLRRIQAFANGLDIASERGTPLEEIDPGLRAIPFESVILAVRVRGTTVTVARVFHASQDWGKQLRREVEARARIKSD
jgi:plasmid stabilization system protein ParE